MSYDRRWLEDVGSEDSHGRTLWALATCAAKDADPARRGWAMGLFEKALPAVEKFSSPRAWAFTLLALTPYCATVEGDAAASRMRRLLADRLMSLLKANRRDGWHWFENVLAYDNARLPQALIETGIATGTPGYIDAGLQSLRWLMAHQTAPSSCFRPVGSDSFGKIHHAPAMFDQQPVEATATIAACLAAAQAERQGHHGGEPSPEWLEGAKSAFDWFLGANDLQVPLINFETGGCLDGLHADRANQNMGAESVLSYLMALVEIRRLKRAGASSDTAKLAPPLALIA
jgi:hypothetical protein